MTGSVNFVNLLLEKTDSLLFSILYNERTLVSLLPGCNVVVPSREHILLVPLL